MRHFGRQSSGDAAHGQASSIRWSQILANEEQAEYQSASEQDTEDDRQKHIF